MNLLILTDPKVGVHDPVFGYGQDSCALFREASWSDLVKDPSHLFIDFTTPDNEQVLSSKVWDIIIVYNALEAYLANRFKLKGRPWICVASFHVEDLHVFYQTSIPSADMGIDVILTNCRPFVESASPHIPVKFMWPPIDSVDKTDVFDYPLGTYVPDVFDRDFSLLEYCAGYLESKGLLDKLVVVAEDRQELLTEFPKAVFTKAVHGAAPSLLDQDRLSFQFYVPVHRVSDILFGCISSDFLYAIACGSYPIVMDHNKFPLRDWISPSFNSLKSLNIALDHICGFREYEMSVHLPFDVHKTVQAFIDTVVTAYRRKVDSAAT
jgi:hypothetical protein